MEHLTPDKVDIAPHRNANIDAIRGLALLGIFFLNIFYMGNNYDGYAKHEISPMGDILVEMFSNFFLEARFISLFSMLFGVGLAIQFDRFSKENKNPLVLIKSRLSWLIFFGVIHGIFIWSGDILFAYGLSGFLSLCYIRLDNTMLIKKSVLFMIIGFVIFTALSLFSPEPAIIRGSEAFEEQYLIWSGPYSEQLFMQLMIFATMAFMTPLTLMWLISGLMLLGVYLYRKGIFIHGFSNKQLILFAVATLFLSSLDNLFIFSSSVYLASFSEVLVIASAIPMALIYIHIVVKICQNRAAILKPLQNVGKLAFSLYIFQSICGVILFRHIDPSLMQTLDRPGYMMIALSFSLFQVILASVYLTYFNQGPLEKLWRKLASPKASAPIAQVNNE
ncbi:DUF418 domain-containing protein [Shewanella hanedai]|uniref:DUF418 domain-containing protein n=1 Tax=Shewanella hanedai TaxID=25 RepID=A0A553JJB8_SHEHA|nr:DUF418 domain-containing protein [Shewanella hanedai]TRY12544.1 DUF418 domain-containing protein [Shewanella hanedai]GGI95154.1 DUF418 domain-containing protein [Shewanella hanedai]